MSKRNVEAYGKLHEACVHAQEQLNVAQTALSKAASALEAAQLAAVYVPDDEARLRARTHAYPSGGQWIDQRAMDRELELAATKMREMKRNHEVAQAHFADAQREVHARRPRGYKHPENDPPKHDD
jgi:hypothetical protein